MEKKKICFAPPLRARYYRDMHFYLFLSIYLFFIFSSLFSFFTYHFFFSLFSLSAKSFIYDQLSALHDQPPQELRDSMIMPSKILGIVLFLLFFSIYYPILVLFIYFIFLLIERFTADFYCYNFYSDCARFMSKGSLIFGYQIVIKTN